MSTMPLTFIFCPFGIDETFAEPVMSRILMFILLSPSVRAPIMNVILSVALVQNCCLTNPSMAEKTN